MREHAQYEEKWEPERNSAEWTTGRAVGWLLVGIGIGAGVALLLTPANGREVRSSIARGYRRTLNGIGDGISRGAHELRQRGSNLLHFGRRHTVEPRSQQG